MKTPLPFVGREAEIARIESALDAGRNVILLGKFGIGRTALAREVASRNARRWRLVFTDFSAPGTTACASILAQLDAKSRHAVAEHQSAKRLSRAIASFEPKRGRRLVVVLDDIRKVTRPKINLIHALRDPGRHLFIAVLESFVPAEDVMRMRVALDPALVVEVERLGHDASVSFFARTARDFDLTWTETDIDLLADTMHGYPLEMVEVAQRARARSRGCRRS